MRTRMIHILYLLALPFLVKAQQAQKFIDSINSSVVKNGFNKLNSSGLRDGFWIEVIQRSGAGHYVTVDVRSGIFSNGKKVGIWKTLELGTSLNRTEYFLDNFERKKIECTYFANGNIENEGFYSFDKNALDSVLTKDRHGTPVFVPTRGKFVRDGNWRVNWENGQTKELGTYRLDKRYGRWIFFDENGKFIGSKQF